MKEAKFYKSDDGAKRVIRIVVKPGEPSTQEHFPSFDTLISEISEYVEHLNTLVPQDEDREPCLLEGILFIDNWWHESPTLQIHVTHPSCPELPQLGESSPMDSDGFEKKLMDYYGKDGIYMRNPEA